MLRFTKHLVFRPEQGLSQKFMFVAYGSAEHALEAAKRFASLFDKYQLELSQMKNKTQRSEYLARRNLKVKRIIADSRLDLRAQLIAGDSPLCENEMKELPLAKEQHSGKPPISAESLSEGVFQYNDSFRVVFDTDSEQIVRVFASEGNANSYFETLMEMRKTTSFLGP